MTPTEVAALLARHGLAPNWRHPIKPAPVVPVGEKTRVVVQQSPSKLFVHHGWCWTYCGGRTWT